MLLINCPYCGDRSELEFVNAGEANLVRPPAAAELSDQQWAEYLFYRKNPKGVFIERWRHIHGCGKFFNAVRDTATDKIIETYRSGAGPIRHSANQVSDR